MPKCWIFRQSPFFVVQGLDANDSIVDFKPLNQIKGKGGITELDIRCLEAIVELAGDSYTDVQEVENHTGYKLQSIRNFATKLSKQEGGLLVAHTLSDNRSKLYVFDVTKIKDHHVKNEHKPQPMEQHDFEFFSRQLEDVGEFDLTDLKIDRLYIQEVVPLLAMPLSRITEVSARHGITPQGKTGSASDYIDISLTAGRNDYLPGVKATNIILIVLAYAICVEHQITIIKF